MHRKLVEMVQQYLRRLSFKNIRAFPVLNSRYSNLTIFFLLADFDHSLVYVFVTRLYIHTYCANGLFFTFNPVSSLFPAQVLGVLGQDGILRFLNINTCKLLFDVGSLTDPVHNVTLSPAGRHIVAVMVSGNINVYSVDALSAELNRVGRDAIFPTLVGFPTF